MRLAPSAQIFRHSAQIGYILVIFFASAESPPRSQSQDISYIFLICRI